MIASVFEVAHGKILRVVACPAGMTSAQCAPGEDWIEGRWPDDRYYISNYRPVEIPPQPSPAHVFDYATKTWIDPRTIADLRAEAWARIKSARDAAERGGMTFDGSTFDTDVLSQQRIAGAVQMAQLALAAGTPWSIEWTLLDNTVRSLDANQMIGVGVALATHINAQHVKARGLRALIDAATTLEQLEAIQW